MRSILFGDLIISSSVRYCVWSVTNKFSRNSTQSKLNVSPTQIGSIGFAVAFNFFFVNHCVEKDIGIPAVNQKENPRSVLKGKTRQPNN